MVGGSRNEIAVSFRLYIPTRASSGYRSAGAFFAVFVQSPVKLREASMRSCWVAWADSTLHGLEAKSGLEV